MELTVLKLKKNLFKGKPTCISKKNQKKTKKSLSPKVKR